MGPMTSERMLDPAKVSRARAVLSAATPAATEEWAGRFALLGDHNRLRLLIAIHAAPDICVNDLAAATQMSDTAVSQSLRLLKARGWVRAHRSGKTMQYALDDHTVHDLLHLLGAGHGTGEP